MVKINRTQCAGCPHYVIVRTLNHPDGELSCRFAFMPCDTCRQSAEARKSNYGADSGNYGTDSGNY